MVQKKMVNGEERFFDTMQLKLKTLANNDDWEHSVKSQQKFLILIWYQKTSFSHLRRN